MLNWGFMNASTCGQEKVLIHCINVECPIACGSWFVDIFVGTFEQRKEEKKQAKEEESRNSILPKNGQGRCTSQVQRLCSAMPGQIRGLLGQKMVEGAAQARRSACAAP